MMLVIGAFAMLSLLTLSINATIITTLSLTAESEMILNAHAFSQSMLDEILTRSFDENTTGTKRVYNFSELTPYGSFGWNGLQERINYVDTTFDSRRKFDDIDDYQGYKRKVKNALGWTFNVIDSVHYVREHRDSADVISTSPTFYKRISVYVYNDMLPKKANGDVVPLVMKDISVYRRFF